MSESTSDVVLRFYHDKHEEVPDQIDIVFNAVRIDEQTIGFSLPHKSLNFFLPPDIAPIPDAFDLFLKIDSSTGVGVGIGLPIPRYTPTHFPGTVVSPEDLYKEAGAVGYISAIHNDATLGAMFRLIVSNAITGKNTKERDIATTIYGRDPKLFRPAVDDIARINLKCLQELLNSYYLSANYKAQETLHMMGVIQRVRLHINKHFEVIATYETPEYTPTATEIMRQVEFACLVPPLNKAPQRRAMFIHIVEHTLRGEPTNEKEVAARIYGKELSSTGTGSKSSIVRTELHRLRNDLRSLYRGLLANSPVSLNINESFQVVGQYENQYRTHPLPSGVYRADLTEAFAVTLPAAVAHRLRRAHITHVHLVWGELSFLHDWPLVMPDGRPMPQVLDREKNPLVRHYDDRGHRILFALPVITTSMGASLEHDSNETGERSMRRYAEIAESGTIILPEHIRAEAAFRTPAHMILAESDPESKDATSDRPTVACPFALMTADVWNVLQRIAKESFPMKSWHVEWETKEMVRVIVSSSTKRPTVLPPPAPGDSGPILFEDETTRICKREVKG